MRFKIGSVWNENSRDERKPGLAWWLKILRVNSRVWQLCIWLKKNKVNKIIIQEQQQTIVQYMWWNEIYIYIYTHTHTHLYRNIYVDN